MFVILVLLSIVASFFYEGAILYYFANRVGNNITDNILFAAIT